MKVTKSTRKTHETRELVSVNVISYQLVSANERDPSTVTMFNYTPNYVAELGVTKARNLMTTKLYLNNDTMVRQVPQMLNEFTPATEILVHDWQPDILYTGYYEFADQGTFINPAALIAVLYILSVEMESVQSPVHDFVITNTQGFDSYNCSGSVSSGYRMWVTNLPPDIRAFDYILGPELMSAIINGEDPAAASLTTPNPVQIEDPTSTMAFFSRHDAQLENQEDIIWQTDFVRRQVVTYPQMVNGELDMMNPPQQRMADLEGSNLPNSGPDLINLAGRSILPRRKVMVYGTSDDAEYVHRARRSIQRGQDGRITHRAEVQH